MAVINPERRDLSRNNDTQIRVISSMEPEICVKVLRNLSENLGPKFPDTSFDYFKVNFACLDDPFSEIFQLEAITAAKRWEKEKKESKN